MIIKIEETAYRTLEHSPAAVVRFRLPRDFLRLPAAGQRPDGGWGPFHSRNTRLKQKIPTTEVGVERAIALGLDASQPILDRAARYVLDIMAETRPFPDTPEVNDRWPAGKRLFLASTLALIRPDQPALEPDHALWRDIALAAFQGGKYDQEAEIAAHDELTGANFRDSYLVLNHKYQLRLLGSLPGTLPGDIEEALLRWLWRRPDGIGYLGVPLDREPPRKPGPFDRWLASHELLARAFPAWTRHGRPAVQWLWAQPDAGGYWDFGPQPPSLSGLPLSDDLRRRTSRRFDWTTRILDMLRRSFDEAPTRPRSHPLSRPQ